MTDQAVNGWRKTGRINKYHLPALALLSGKPLEWWLEIPAKVESGESLDPDTMEMARQYQTLDADERAAWRATIEAVQVIIKKYKGKGPGFNRP